jgi:tRNA threonylcarbamoyladenosine biosynthesis protein TsaB
MADTALILSIETATGCGSVSLTRGGVANGRILAEATVQPEISHSRRLLGSVDWIMQAAGVDWAELDGIAISLGPGSFTGLRIGMAAAKGIVLATSLPLLGVPTLDGIAIALPVIDCPLCCLLDARKQEIYAAWYHPDSNGFPEPTGSVEVLAPRILADRINGSVVLAGSGATVYSDIFQTIPGVRLLSSALTAPRAARIGFVAAGHLAGGAVLDPAVAAPLYVRASDAEINLAKQ